MSMIYDGPMHVVSGAPGARLLLIADHASNAIPDAYQSLGLAPHVLERHVAWDIGIAALTRELASALDLPAILAGFSRLLIDANRGADDPTLVMRISDGEIIPGNARVDASETARRIAEYCAPYHRAIDGALDAIIAAGQEPLLISMHSFTPHWRGRARPWHCGILWGGDHPTAEFLLASLRAEKGLNVGDNEPYSGKLEGDCLDQHGTQRNIRHSLIEIRQDLLETPQAREQWVRRLVPILQSLMNKIAKENA